MREAYHLKVNGTEHAVDDAWLGESLLHVLRERLGFQGAKGGCEQGECGSCSVLLDGELVCACLVLAAAATGRGRLAVGHGDDLRRSGADDVQLGRVAGPGRRPGRSLDPAVSP